MKIYRTIVALIIICIILSILVLIKISQYTPLIRNEESYQFVVGRMWKYCYVENQKPKNLVILAKFDRLEDCEEFVKNTLYYDR